MTSQEVLEEICRYVSIVEHLRDDSVKFKEGFGYVKPEKEADERVDEFMEEVKRLVTPN